MSPHRIVALAAAAVLGVLGGWGLVAVATSGTDAASGVGLPFGVGTGPLLATTHLLMALALVVCAVVSELAARAAEVAFGVLLLVIGLFGVFAVGSDANVIAATGSTNLTHMVLSCVLLASGLGVHVSTPRREPLN